MESTVSEHLQILTNKWKKSIVGHSEEDPRSLIPHPDNPRTHEEEQRSVFRESVSRLGELDEIKCSIHSKHIINGHMRREEAIENQEPTVWVTWLDLTPEEEIEALFFYDRISKMAVWDPEKTIAILDRIPKLEENSEKLLAEVEREMKDLLEGKMPGDDEDEDDLFNDDFFNGEDEDMTSLGATGDYKKDKMFKIFLSQGDYDELLLLLKRLGKTSGMQEGQPLMIFPPK